MYNHILVPVDPSHGEVGERIVSVARFLAGASGKVSLLTVLEPVPGYVANYIPRETTEKIHADAKAQLETLARSAGANVDAVLRTGSAANVIIEEAGRLGCDAIVLGSHRPDYRDYLIGSTAARVVRHAQCSVIVERSAQITL